MTYTEFFSQSVHRKQISSIFLTSAFDMAWGDEEEWDDWSPPSQGPGENFRIPAFHDPQNGAPRRSARQASKGLHEMEEIAPGSSDDGRDLSQEIGQCPTGEAAEELVDAEDGLCESEGDCCLFFSLDMRSDRSCTASSQAACGQGQQAVRALLAGYALMLLFLFDSYGST